MSTPPQPGPDASKPGLRTSEGLLVALKTSVAAVVMLATTFGVGIPHWLRPDAPWLAGAAFIGSALALAVYTVRRTGLKQAALTLWGGLQATQSPPTPQPVTDPPTEPPPDETLALARRVTRLEHELELPPIARPRKAAR